MSKPTNLVAKDKYEHVQLIQFKEYDLVCIDKKDEISKQFYALFRTSQPKTVQKDKVR